MMLTQTHMLLAAAAFGRKSPVVAGVAAVAALVPDIPDYAIHGLLKFKGIPDLLTFGILYFQNWWQVTNAIAHSLVIWPAIGLVCWILARRAVRSVRFWLMLASVAAAAICLHAVADFLTQTEDAHMHFWPLTAWKFASPVSYWNPMHYGREFRIAEIIVGLALAAYLIRTCASFAVRLFSALAAGLYLLIPILGGL